MGWEGVMIKGHIRNFQGTGNVDFLTWWLHECSLKLLTVHVFSSQFKSLKVLSSRDGGEKPFHNKTEKAGRTQKAERSS